MNLATREIIKLSIALKEQSIKRAINTSKNPRLSAVYEQELNELKEASLWLDKQKVDTPT
jgi:hypothetical protein